MIGESWEIVDRPEEQSVVASGLMNTLGNTTLSAGSNYLQPYITGASLQEDSPTTLLVTDQF